LVEENKKYQRIPSFPLKTIRRYVINNKLNSNFQLVLFSRNGENNGPLKVLLSQSQSAISPDVMLDCLPYNKRSLVNKNHAFSIISV
jgi:hypothetical protein